MIATRVEEHFNICSSEIFYIKTLQASPDTYLHSQNKNHRIVWVGRDL